MSVLTDILDRLTGISMVAERLGETGRKLDRLGEAVLDHEKRLIRLETLAPPSSARRSARRGVDTLG